MHVDSAICDDEWEKELLRLLFALLDSYARCCGLILRLTKHLLVSQRWGPPSQINWGKTADCSNYFSTRFEEHFHHTNKVLIAPLGCDIFNAAEREMKHSEVKVIQQKNSFQQFHKMKKPWIQIGFQHGGTCRTCLWHFWISKKHFAPITI